MENNNKKNGLLLSFLKKITSTNLSLKEYAFALMITVVQISMPFIYELLRGNNARGWQIPITGIILFIAFYLVWQTEEFVQTNLVDFIYFQIIIIIGTLALGMPVVFKFREEIQNLYRFQIPYFEGRMQGIVLIFLVSLIIILSFVFYDLIMGILLWIYVRHYCTDFQNPYFEKIKAVNNLEDYKAYQKQKMREAYEKMAEEIVYQPKPLFENTKFFKEITEIEQVKPRYHAMMKIYHPDNPGGSVEITQEIQKEYREIARKYNLY